MAFQGAGDSARDHDSRNAGAKATTEACNVRKSASVDAEGPRITLLASCESAQNDKPEGSCAQRECQQELQPLKRCGQQGCSPRLCSESL